MSTTTRGYISITMAATLWGVAGAAAKYLFASKAVPPFLLVQVRMGLSFLILAAVLAVAAPQLLKVRRENLPFFAIWGVLGMAAIQYTYLLAISETNVATAIFLQYLAPIFTALYAFGFEGQKLGTRLLTCLGLAMAGSFLLIFGGTARLLVSPTGLIAGISSAVFLSFYTIYGAKGVGKLSPWTLLCYGLGAGTLFYLLADIVILGTGHAIPGVAMAADRSMWPFFLYIATLATIVPFGLYLSGLRSVNPTQATITGMLEPVIGGLAAYFALGESLRPVQVGGGVLIVLAVILLQIKRGEAES